MVAWKVIGSVTTAGYLCKGSLVGCWPLSLLCGAGSKQGSGRREARGRKSEVGAGRTRKEAKRLRSLTEVAESSS